MGASRASLGMAMPASYSAEGIWGPTAWVHPGTGQRHHAIPVSIMLLRSFACLLPAWCSYGRGLG
jgi:hypothetical protein